MAEQVDNVFNLKDIMDRAGTRRRCYNIVQKVYDLPNFGPVITQDYLAELIKPVCSLLRVKRSKTHTIPKGRRRNWNSIDAFNLLVKTLEEKGKTPCGFTHFTLPNIEWMLRMIIWADPA